MKCFFCGASRATFTKLASTQDGFGIAQCAIRYYSTVVTTITCKIPDELGAHLEVAARQRRVPKSQIVREAIVASLKRKKTTVSAFDLIKDACGIIKGGPRDYASHRRHLRGFGER